jgi:hypothetical protein
MKALYLGAGCDMDPLLHLANEKVTDKRITIGDNGTVSTDFTHKYITEFIFVDTLPRSEYDDVSDHYSPIEYRYNFVPSLISKCEAYGYTLNREKSYIFDDEYVYKVMKWKDKAKAIFTSAVARFTSCRKTRSSNYSENDDKEETASLLSNHTKGIPPHSNPTLFYFVNTKTNQILKYYVSTNILYNLSTELFNDINKSDILIISNYFPNKRLFELYGFGEGPYAVQPKMLYVYSNTDFTLPSEDESEYDPKYKTALIPFSDCSKAEREVMRNNIHWQIQKKYKHDTAKRSKYISHYFSRYFLVSRKTGKVIYCRDYDDIMIRQKSMCVGEF